METGGIALITNGIVRLPVLNISYIFIGTIWTDCFHHMFPGTPRLSKNPNVYNSDLKLAQQERLHGTSKNNFDYIIVEKCVYIVNWDWWEYSTKMQQVR